MMMLSRCHKPLMAQVESSKVASGATPTQSATAVAAAAAAAAGCCLLAGPSIVGPHGSRLHGYISSRCKRGACTYKTQSVQTQEWLVYERTGALLTPDDAVLLQLLDGSIRESDEGKALTGTARDELL